MTLKEEMKEMRKEAITKQKEKERDLARRTEKEQEVIDKYIEDLLKYNARRENSEAIFEVVESVSYNHNHNVNVTTIR